MCLALSSSRTLSGSKREDRASSSPASPHPRPAGTSTSTSTSTGAGTAQGERHAFGHEGTNWAERNEASPAGKPRRNGKPGTRGQFFKGPGLGLFS